VVYSQKLFKLLGSLLSLGFYISCLLLWAKPATGVAWLLALVALLQKLSVQPLGSLPTAFRGDVLRTPPRSSFHAARFASVARKPSSRRTTPTALDYVGSPCSFLKRPRYAHE